MNKTDCILECSNKVELIGSIILVIVIGIMVWVFMEISIYIGSDSYKYNKKF